MVIKTALIYTRVSEDKTGEHRSVGEQEAACREICVRNGWDVVEVLSDNSIGASRHSSGHRDGWDKVHARIER
ncbi:recombinase family protein, partial [bacterium]|nr:recombinase family protein [bacterium]